MHKVFRILIDKLFHNNEDWIELGGYRKYKARSTSSKYQELYARPIRHCKDTQIYMDLYIELSDGSSFKPNKIIPEEKFNNEYKLA